MYFRLFMMTTNLFVIFNVKQLWTGGSFRILLPFFQTSWGVGVLNAAIFKLIRMLEWNTKHFPLNLQSGLTSSNFRDVGGGFELRNQIRHCAGSSCLCNRNFGGVWTTTTPPPGTPLVHTKVDKSALYVGFETFNVWVPLVCYTEFREKISVLEICCVSTTVNEGSIAKLQTVCFWCGYPLRRFQCFPGFLDTWHNYQ